MSYILEALKRADAERQRGGVPGLHAQTGGGLTAAETGGSGVRRWGLAGTALALLLIGGAAAWWWHAGPVAPPGLGSGTAPASPVLLPPVPVAAAPAGPTGLPVAAPAAPAVAAWPTPAVASTAAALAVPASALASAPRVPPGAAPRSLPVPRSAPASAAAAVLATAAPRAAVAQVPASATAVTVSPALAAAAPVAAVPERLPQLAELPDALRREVGTLNPGGSIYAEQAAARMVILNGQVFREGDLLAAQLRVEQIRPRSVVFSLRGQRFELAL